MSVATGVDHGLLGVLAEHAGARATGVITALRGRHKRLFCIDRGDLVSARSNVIEEQFGVTLVRTGVSSNAALARATQLAEERGLKLAAFLLEEGTPDGPTLCSAMADHVRWLLEDTLTWVKADISFAKGRPKLEGEPTARLHGATCVVEYARTVDGSPQALRMRIGPPDMRPVLVRRRRRLFEGVPALPLVDHLLQHCAGEADIDELLATFDGPAEDLLRGLYALRLLGLVDNQRVELPAAKDGVPSHDECVARFAAAVGADHYVVLRVTKACTRDEVRDAYYYLAKRFHPDRLRIEELEPLSTRIEDYFSKVTEAYNTLYDPELRADYDRQQADQSSTREVDRAAEPGYLARQNYARGKTLVDKGRYQDAIQFLENAVTQDASGAMYHLELGRVLIRHPRRRREAETFLLGAIERNPTLVDAYLALGQLYRKLGRDDEAVTRLREALRWDPNHAQAKAELREMGAKETDGEGGLLRGLFRR